MSKWDKLIERVRSLSPDIRFEELRKILEEYGYEMQTPEVEAVIIHFEKMAAILLLSQSINR